VTDYRYFWLQNLTETSPEVSQRYDQSTFREVVLDTSEHMPSAQEQETGIHSSPDRGLARGPNNYKHTTAVRISIIPDIHTVRPKISCFAISVQGIGRPTAVPDDRVDSSATKIQI